jgi:hypothetical protein
MEPKDWAERLPADVRDVLDAGIGVNAPSGAKQAVWGAMVAKLPAATVAASGVAGGVTAVSLLKPLAVGLALGAATATGLVGYHGLTSSAPPTSASVASPRVAPRPSPPHETERVAEPLPEVAPVPLAPAPTAKLVPAPSAAAPLSPAVASSSVASFPSDARPLPQENATVLESRRVASARALLRAGDARRTLAELDALAVDFPLGVLVQERDAIRIEALLALGERERARELATRFLARHPQSPHAAAVERAVK